MALTQQRAEQRSQHVKNGSVLYYFNICLEKGESYSGYAQIFFDLLTIPSELVLDFKGKQVTRVNQNGHQIDLNLSEGFIHLSVASLKVGPNIVGVHYLNSYNNDGSGCVSFIDVDSKQYIYTQFEPYFANKVFPCFDQPDLKAKMILSVISPFEWKKVLSNQHPRVEKELQSSEDYLTANKFGFPEEVKEYLKGKSGKLTLFPETKLLPTYLFCFIAGQYLQLKLDESKQYKNIPMSLYSIESLYAPLKNLAPFIFEITIQCMKFYDKFFNYSFAFNKYDQVFAHEYRWGAMQNAGIVTFNDERFLFKQKVSTEEMLSFASTIAHELSHHWFGNLVTMKWWDDLWLNESFATFIAFFVLEKLKGNIKTLHYQSAMASFYTKKKRGYNQDQMITTHPIRAKVSNTSVADAIFDGITYSKGASTMEQLFYLMGEDNFGQALSAYFHRYQWKNATIDDFLAEMQNFFKVKEFTLNDWKKSWLETSSLNIIEAHWNPEDTSKDAKLTIKQSVYTEEHNTLRMHKIKVALFRENSSADILEVLVLPQPETVITYDGSRHYKAVQLNYEDYDYVKTKIDPISLQFYKTNINSIKDVLSRTLIWDNFSQQIKDAQLTSPSYVDLVISSIQNEPSDSIVDMTLDNVYEAINIFTPIKIREELNTKMFRFVLQWLPSLKEGQQNRITILKNKLVDFSSSQQSKKMLLKWNNNEVEALKGIEMTLGQKWRTVAKAFTLDDLKLQQKQVLFQSQKTQDPSDTSIRYRHICDALKSTEAQFDLIYQIFTSKESKNSVTLKTSIASGWNSSYHQQRLLKYRERYFKDIQGLVNDLSAEHFEVFYMELAPIDDDLADQIEQYSKIVFPGGKEKCHDDVQKMVDRLTKRLKAYQLYQ